MSLRLFDYIHQNFGISETVLRIAQSIDHEISDIFSGIDSVRTMNQLKVIKAMQNQHVSDSHFGGTTGYGYDDRGRDVLDAVYAEVFQAEDALVRHQIVAGTQAIAICLYGNLRHGDELLSVTGKPYDTLEEVIGIRGDGHGSLKETGVSYRQIDLDAKGYPQWELIASSVRPETRMVFVQRSRGYAWRPTLRIDDIAKIVKLVKAQNPDCIVMVDNCYGEFVEEKEPTAVGVDLCAGSLIKNPGGGLAVSGGYVAGRKKLVDNAAYRLTTPGLGRKVGPSLGQNRLLYQGLFQAPHVVAESLKGAVFCAALMERLGYKTSPAARDFRGDIIQAICFEQEAPLIAFCQGIQKGSAVDAFVEPQPWDMPGYDCPVIMAAGAFVQGSSIELSADAPVKAPFTAYMQGGLVYDGVRIGVLTAVQKMVDQGMIRL